MSTTVVRSNAKAGAAPAAVKSRRVRTGCLTCRERHLKCDEAIPDCQNCRKSSRSCKRGVKLNFLDITVYEPLEIPPSESWEVDFKDQSLEVASEYQGGLLKYNVPKAKSARGKPTGQITTFEPRRLDQAVLPLSSGVIQPSVERLNSGKRPATAWKPIRTLYDRQTTANQDSLAATVLDQLDEPSGRHDDYEAEVWSWWSPPNELDPYMAQITRDRLFAREQSSTASIAPQATHAPSRNGSPQYLEGGARLPVTPPEDAAQCSKHTPREFLHEFEEVVYMEVFVNEVGIWMDCFDKEQHFGQHVPFRALKTPMLLNALLACGALHLSTADQEHADTASIYYNTATSQLLRNLQNPERNTEECATAAVVLNVYDAMTDKPTHRMSHVAGARALIGECGWTAASSGIGSACFWLNVGMEVLDCLARGLRMTWNPNDWGVDMNFKDDQDENDAMGGEEIWVHRMFYIAASIADFRASSPSYRDMSAHAEQVARSSRLCEWQKMKQMCDTWNDACPRSMHPMAYLEPSQSRSESCFPRIWLIKRPALIGRLLYHMGLCILAQTNPLEPAGTSKEMTWMQQHHAHQICGIVSHSRDRSTWTVAVRSIEIAAPSLVDVQEQEESLRILDGLNTRGSQWLRDLVYKLRRDWDSERARRDAQPIRSPVSESNHQPMHEEHGLLADFTTAPPLAPSVRSRALSTQSAVSVPRSMDVDPSPLMSRDLMEALRSADFRRPDHPYKNWWQPASRTNSISHFHEHFPGIGERGHESRMNR